MAKVAGVVVLYNPSSTDLKNIDLYIDSIDKLYIVDNSDKKITKKFDNKKIEYIFNNSNLGMATALNIGAKEATKDKFKWLLTMDQDTKITNEIVNKIKDKIDNTDTSKIGIVSPWHDTKLNIKKPDEDIDYPLDVMTSGNFLNLDIYKIIGGFRDDLFIDGIDIEYCLRLRKNNYKVMRLNYISMKHNLGDIQYHKFLGKEFMCTNHNYLRNYYMARNYRYIKKEYRDIAPEFCDTLVKYKGIMFKIVMFEKDKFRKIRHIFMGIRDYHKGITGKYRY